MKKSPLIIASALALLTAVSCSTGTDSKGTEKKPEERTILYYTSPMDPTIRSDVPMKDPMGMDYLPVYADGSGPADAPEGVAISETDARRLNVKTVAAEYRPFGLALKAVGRISYDERAWVHVSARFGGRVETLEADFTGARVEAGKPLLSVYSPAAVAAQQELLQLRRRSSSVDNLVFTTAKEKLRLWGLTEAQIAGILESGKAMYALPVLSPISGTVIAKTVVPGMYVNEGEMLFEIADLARVWMEADVYEQDIARITVGDRVAMTSIAHPGIVFEGTISFISPTLDPETRTIRVRANVDNRRGLLKPNMYVEAVVKNNTAPEKLVIPTSALLDTGTRKIVYVDGGNGRFIGRRVLVEASSGGLTAIAAGLEEGDQVVVSGAFLIDSQAQLAGAKDIDYEEKE